MGRSSDGVRDGAMLVGLAVLLLLAPTPTEGWARPVVRRWRKQPRNESGTGSPGPERRIRLDFRGVDIGKVLELFSIAAGKTLVTDPNLTGPVTILSPRPVPLQEGLRALEAALQSRGYTLEQDPLLMRVVPASRARDTTRPLASIQGGRARSGAVGRGNPRRSDRGPQIAVLKLEAASATQVARIITELFRPAAVGRGGWGRGSRFQRAGFQWPGFVNRQGNSRPASPTLASLANTEIRASADEYTNSVVVVAPPSIAGEIRRMVEQLDRKTPPDVTTRVFRLQYAYAEELAPVVSSVLLGVAPASAAGGALQNLTWQRRVRLLARVGSLNATSGQVVPEARTNSLVVSTTAANMAIVEKLLRRLDTPAQPRPTTVVVPLQNARATDVGLLLNQTFSPTSRGYGSGTGGPGSAARPWPPANSASANRSPRGLAPR